MAQKLIESVGLGIGWLGPRVSTRATFVTTAAKGRYSDSELILSA